MKLLSFVIAILVIAGCSSNNDQPVNKRGYHPVKIHLAGGEFVKLHAAATKVLMQNGATQIDSSGDSVMWGKVTIKDPPTTFDCEIRLRSAKDGVWYEITSENWSNEQGLKVNHGFAEQIADKMGFTLPKP